MPGSAPIASGRYFLRPVLSADLPELTDLWIDSWQRTMPEIDFEARRAWFVERIVGLTDSGAAVIVAFDPDCGAMAGFVAIDPESRWLDQIAVAPAHAGRGLAADLMTVAEQIAGDSIRLDVNVDNPRALGFYRKRGFRTVGEGINPVSGRKTVLMEWRRRPQEGPADDPER